jgi:hypothetical protein
MIIEYLIALSIGCIFGYILGGILGKNSMTEELEDAYKKGRADEKQRIINELKKIYDVSPVDPVDMIHTLDEGERKDEKIHKSND